MSNEQNDNDALVSATYRDTALETTPPKLDDAVLRMAASGQSVSFSEKFSSWMTPLTWAVTAGLCVALVMNVPDIDEHPQMPESVSPAASIEEAFAAEDSDVIDEAEKMASLRDGQDQPAPVARQRLEQAKRTDDVAAGAAAENQRYEASAAVSSDAVALELDLEKRELKRETYCDSPTRAQADTWYKCVQQLRDEDRTDDADSEMLELMEKFPGFRPE